MNNQHKRAGQSTWEMAEKRHKKRIWFAVVSVVIVLLVERTPPIKGVMIINKKILLSLFQGSNPKAQTLPAWEHREKILKVLCA